MGIVFGKTGVAEPIYDVVLSRTSGVGMPYEVRRYGKRFAIETNCVSEEENGKSFMKLAKYIGVSSPPQNDGGKAIAMTAPVITDMSSVAGKTIAMTAPVVMAGSTMQFILPAEYDDLSKIPKPLNSEVSIAEVPASVGAIHKFSGWVTKDQASDKIDKLTTQLKSDGLSLSETEAQTKAQLWQFHPPFTIPFFRRNEVWIELTEKQVESLLKKFGGANK